jgi:acetyl-CoA decarbonylase/synthase complex subunit gamma
MALSGIQIYKLLPQTNCKECGFPTCLAFAMKLAAKQVELSACPYVSEASKVQLEESAAPPIRLISLKSDGHELKVGNEVVLFRHEKTFYNKPGIFVAINDNLTLDEISTIAKSVEQYHVNYVGIELAIDGFMVQSINDNPETFVSAIKMIRSISKKPFILFTKKPGILKEAVKLLNGECNLLGIADKSNWEEMASIAKDLKCPLVVFADSLDDMAALTENIKTKGVEDLVLNIPLDNLNTHLTQQVQIRRMAIKSNYRPLGFPTISVATSPMSAVQAVTKYNGFVVLDHFSPELVYPLLVLRQNIYTDPQKPIQVQPGVYEINKPKPEDPVLVTTNFSITYFSVANEVEGSGLPAWLVVVDAEGMSVLTGWAAGKFDAERITKSIKGSNLAEKVSKKVLVIPGHVAVLSGELEAELPEWQIRVGPREAVDIPKFLKQAL